MNVNKLKTKYASWTHADFEAAWYAACARGADDETIMFLYEHMQKTEQECTCATCRTLRKQIATLERELKAVDVANKAIAANNATITHPAEKDEEIDPWLLRYELTVLKNVRDEK